MGEDGSRSRHGRLLANLALIRNAMLQVLSDALEEQSLLQLRKSLHSHPAAVWSFLQTHELKTKDPTEYCRRSNSGLGFLKKITLAVNVLCIIFVSSPTFNRTLTTDDVNFVLSAGRGL
jgi:hypothetical protein